MQQRLFQTTSSFLFLSLGLLSFLAITAQNAVLAQNPRPIPPPATFFLYAARTQAGVPGSGYYDRPIESWLEVEDGTGNVIFNKTQGQALGFGSLIDSIPFGQVFRSNPKQQAFLAPSSPQGHFQFKFKAHVPGNGLVRNFTSSIWECHGKCTRPELLFRDDGPYGSWYITPYLGKGKWEWVVIEGAPRKLWRGIWKVKWKRGGFTLEGVPTGGLSGLAIVMGNYTGLW